jgi:high-affinity iron transporter
MTMIDVAALLIMVREGFEAALVVAILYAYLRRTGRDDLLAPPWAGVASAFAAAVAIGLGLRLAVMSLEGDPRLEAFAAIMLLAAAVLTWMIFWMRRQARALRGDLEATMGTAIGAPDVKLAVIGAAFLAVLREGVEAALFLLAIATERPGGPTLAGALIGVAIAGVLGWMVVVGGRRMPMRQFFAVTGVVLIVFAAGLVARGVAYLQYAGDLPTLWDAVYDLTGVTWLTTNTEVGRFLSALVGWDPRPSIEQVVVWLTFAGTVGWCYLRPLPAPATVPASRR